MNENNAGVFNSEADFEQAFIELLTECGWEKEIIKYPTEEELIENWKKILFDNNRNIDRLGDYPLTDGEMNQIIDQINKLRTPFSLNSFINGKTVSIKRDNPNDKLHFGKQPISLHIYDRQEIAGGKSHYQIAKQPRFKAKNSIFPERRGDIMLLINGMPVFHIELKQSGHPLSEAWNQIEKYSNEGVFRGMFSLVQIFVAMTPEDAVYFTNPGPDIHHFNKNFFFHWGDFDNVPIHDWAEFTRKFLYIPMAHQLIGFFTIPDKKDGILKVLRSYQYYAVTRIMSVVGKNTWDRHEQKGGFIWHTTGSGKTLTSFKAADLISKTRDADKVVFLVDRIELDAQSLENYQNFADSKNQVQGVDSTDDLRERMMSESPNDALIVASIQKMSRIKDDDSKKIIKDLETINRKRIVFIVDECHRDTFGDMMSNVKDAFPNALFFGFTGTPIFEENAKKGSNSATVFGSELHRYTIGDGIRDGNVLGFDTYMVETYKTNDLKKKVALEFSRSSDEEDALSNPSKKQKYYDVLGMEMAGHVENGKYVKGIEDFLPNEQYGIDTDHPKTVVNDILSKFNTISRGREFHAIFATSSIKEALNYYSLFKKSGTDLKISVLVDMHDDNTDGNSAKIQDMANVIEDYNKMFGTKFTISTYGDMKKDIQLRLAHEKNYIGISNDKNKQLDLLIVVNQMLTGYDSKWINVLYMDKVMTKENIIQAISRTNRIYGSDKPFGLVYYYKKPYTMKRNIREAVEIYSGNKPFLVFVDKLIENIKKFNEIAKAIKEIFTNEGIKDFSKAPESDSSKAKFVKEFNSLIRILECMEVQGFDWEKKAYVDETTGECVEVALSHYDFIVLLIRYKEIVIKRPPSGEGNGPKIPFDVDTVVIEISTGKIDTNYMNSNFERYIKLKFSVQDKKAIDDALTSVYSSFKFLSEEEQKYANILIRDIESGSLIPEEGKTFREYVADYMKKAKDDQINRYAETFGIDAKLLRELIVLAPSEDSINEFGRYDNLKATLDVQKAITFFENKEGKNVSSFGAKSKFDNLTREFILSGGFDL